MSTDNLFRGNKFEITMPKTPILARNITMVDLAGLSLNDTMLPYKSLDINVAGEKIIYGKLDFTFLLDEYLDTYYEVYSWMNATAGTTVKQSEKKEFVQDITLSILNNNSSLVVRKFTFFNCWFTFLGEISLDASDSQTLSTSCTITYDYFKVEKPENDVSNMNELDYDTDIEEIDFPT